MRLKYWVIALIYFHAGTLLTEANAWIRITATRSNLVFKVSVSNPPARIVECVSPAISDDAGNNLPLVIIEKKGASTISIPRWESSHDRIYSGFILIENGSKTSPHFVDKFEGVAANRDAYPQAKSKKGLQVQMLDDAIALGVKHAALNFNIGQMVKLIADSDDLMWNSDGKTFHFDRGYIESIDNQVKPLSASGALVSLILLNYEGADTNRNKILLHPHYDASCPNHLSAFNTSTPDGEAYFKACVEFLAARYSHNEYPHGRVANYIVGNEVNSHWQWANMGRISMETFARDYLRTVRISHTAVRKFSTSARVFISLEHHWNIRGGTPEESFPGREFINYFNQLAKEQGDFDWNLAFHPYPENLFEPRTWNDKSATFDKNTPRITFKNLEMLTEYFCDKKLLFANRPRHIILSEQGFHSDGTPKGELAQAAGYAYAYYKIDRLDGIDAFILHRHVDHPYEGGLNLGLWRRDPMTKKPIYEVFKAADTPEWKKAFEFALPIIGIKSWKEIEPKKKIKGAE